MNNLCYRNKILLVLGYLIFLTMISSQQANGGTLFGIGFGSTGSTLQIVTIDPLTGVPSPIATETQLPIFSGFQGVSTAIDPINRILYILSNTRQLLPSELILKSDLSIFDLNTKKFISRDEVARTTLINVGTVNASFQGTPVIRQIFFDPISENADGSFGTLFGTRLNDNGCSVFNGEPCSLQIVTIDPLTGVPSPIATETQSLISFPDPPTSTAFDPNKRLQYILSNTGSGTVSPTLATRTSTSSLSIFDLNTKKFISRDEVAQTIRTQTRGTGSVVSFSGTPVIEQIFFDPGSENADGSFGTLFGTRLNSNGCREFEAGPCSLQIVTIDPLTGVPSPIATETQSQSKPPFAVGASTAFDPIKRLQYILSNTPFPNPLNLSTFDLSTKKFISRDEVAGVSHIVFDSPCTQLLSVGINFDFKLRGDKSANLVSDAFSSLPNVCVNTLELQAENLANNKNLLKDKINEVKELLEPEGTFIFYIHSHGTYDDFADFPGEDEPEVLSQNCFDFIPDSFCLALTENRSRKPTTGDESIVLTNGPGAPRDLMSDDEFHDLFNDSQWEKINKLFILDTCFSGGFWGEKNPLKGDSGDLATLKKTALIAAAPETEFSYSFGVTGISYLAYAIGGDLLFDGAIEDLLESRSKITFDDLSKAIQKRKQTVLDSFISSTGDFTGFINSSNLVNLESIWIREIPADIQTQFFASPDFQLQLNGNFDQGFEFKIAIKEAQFEVDPDRQDKDKLQIESRIALEPSSDGIDPVNEEVVVAINGFSETIPAGSFIRDDGDEKFVYHGPDNVFGIKKIVIHDDGEFLLKGEGLNFTGVDFNNPVEISLTIGNDFGKTSIQLDDELKFKNEDVD